MNTKSTEDKLTVRFPIGMLDEVRTLAREDTRSLNGEIIALIREAIEQRKRRRGQQK